MKQKIVLRTGVILLGVGELFFQSQSAWATEAELKIACEAEYGPGQCKIVSVVSNAAESVELVNGERILTSCHNNELLLTAGQKVFFDGDLFPVGRTSYLVHMSPDVVPTWARLVNPPVTLV